MAGTSDGDILSFSGTTSLDGISKSGVNTSTTTYPVLVVRTKGPGGTITLQAKYTDASTTNFTLNSTVDYVTSSFNMVTGKTLDRIAFFNQTVSGTWGLDTVAVCGLSPLQVSQKDLVHAKDIRISYGADVLNFRLNNRSGKFVVSTQNPVGFGDHIHLWTGSTSLNHAFGGYVEWRNPERNPADEVWFQARGWGVALHQILVLREYNNSTPRTIINSIIDNDVNASGTGYQITRSFVQDKGTSVAYKAFELKPAWDCFREISDLIVAQGTDKVSMWVDAAENLHLVPMSGTNPNWGTDPFPASYPTSLALKTNQILNGFQKDILNLRNRVHYFAIAQSPGDGDAWTENNASSWDKEGLGANQIITISNESTIIKVGSKSIKVVLSSDNTANAPYFGRFFYPNTKNLALDVSSLGSKRAPPLFDFRFRYNFGAAVLQTNGPNKVFFAETTTKRFEYALVSDGNIIGPKSIFGFQGNQNITQDEWYHISMEIGPFADTRYKLADVGAPVWTNINYVGLYWNETINGIPAFVSTIYLDGWRILGGRYRMAYDNRTVANGRYPDRREHVIFDPISKDETTIENLAKAELLRLRDPVMRATVTTPILGDLIPEQTLTVTAPSADLTNTKLRATRVIHTLSQRGFITEIELTDDYTSAQTLERWRLANALLKIGHPGIKDREIYDLRLAQMDPTFTRIDDAVS